MIRKLNKINQVDFANRIGISQATLSELEKLTIYLIDGLATGPRTIEIGKWSGKAIYSQRSSLSKIMDRGELDRPGVYILKSIPSSDGFSERIYIGEAETQKQTEIPSF